jgi:N-acetylmuramic acid 6-phosphate (MurNAc-6-P) etherase
MVVTVIIASIIASLKVPAVIRVIMYADTFNTDIVFIGNNNDWRLKRIRFLISVMN